MNITKNVVAYFVVGSLTLTSCQTANPYTGESQQAKATTGAIFGGLFGAGIGALSGGSNAERKQRALLGAGVGALAGAGIGAYMDKQESELRRELEGAGVGISRNGNQITLVMPGDITFSTGSSGIVGQFYPTLASVAKVLNKYNRTMVAITGHTDNVGARDYNYRLSEARASSVAQFLQTQAVASQRFQVSGRGMDQPIANNNTAAGRQANRRVSIQLAPLN
ncbi:MAG: OmpA family protein [Verrucomicrobia bacterium]|mgnify:FL=1|jgi:outer membrane protein OmpA-like peptidoglycan-associated protein|nr:OmpA family protein [Verrucomicrobiota bacterium]MDA7508036.1 OmpA family protein [Akkermansiaceae bacterium]MDA7516555.1 OmpA family protein [bacterium]MBT6400658.1 OmpA family protein [Verrucomicrobiota bacterium]MBT7216725.1 OmpA family protein [Verrucomicrobiota bacterium]